MATREQVRLAQARAMGENRDLLPAVRAIARQLGAYTYHTLRSDKSEKGWPDLVIAFPGHVLFVELKGHGRKPTPQQQAWLERLRTAGLDARVWWPMDLLNGTIRDTLLAARAAGRQKTAA